MSKSGKFLISLDFELFWGMRDVATLAGYGDNIRGVRQALPRLLETFTKYDIRATWATVGFLFFSDKETLLSHLPATLPSYQDHRLSPYGDYLASIGADETSDPLHYGASLVRLIQKYPQQEIASHTFSHYYCLEAGQTPEQFRADLVAAKNIAKLYNINLSTLILPRNQCIDTHLAIASELGFSTYRGNENSWLYQARRYSQENILRRAIRLLDAYINLSGHHTYSPNTATTGAMINLPSSRFFRSYSPRLALLDGLKLNRIKLAMTHAAKHGLIYHLWWHPHNFGINQDRNFATLEKILKHYQFLQKKYNFSSETMSSLAKNIKHPYESNS